MTNPVITLRTALTALVLVASATTASAQSYYGGPPSDPRVERYSDYAREGAGAAYGFVGRRACGVSCARSAREFGRDFYDGSRRFSVENGRRLQEYGRDLRRPRRCGGRSGTHNSTPMYCH